MRVLSLSEVNYISGAGPIADGAIAIGGFIGAKLGSADGGALGAEIGGIVCSPAGPESAGVAPAICAAIGYTIGSKYGEVTGLAGGSALGGMVGKAIEDFINNPGESIGDAINSIFGDYNPDFTSSPDAAYSDASFVNSNGDICTSFADFTSNSGGGSGGEFSNWGNGDGSLNYANEIYC